jgi:ribose 5-phosphate isomerase B
LCNDEWLAEMARSHNDANVLSLGGRRVAPDVAERILETFIRTPFEGGRHARRVAQLADIERDEAD